MIRRHKGICGRAFPVSVVIRQARDAVQARASRCAPGGPCGGAPCYLVTSVTGPLPRSLWCRAGPSRLEEPSNRSQPGSVPRRRSAVAVCQWAELQVAGDAGNDVRPGPDAPSSGAAAMKSAATSDGPGWPRSGRQFHSFSESMRHMPRLPPDQDFKFGPVPYSTRWRASDGADSDLPLARRPPNARA
jgi:hypothetical protein